MNNKYTILITALIFAAFIGIVALPIKASVADPTPKEIELKMSFRKLWEDHITWTRLVIIGIVDNIPGTDQATARLLKNYDDMESAMKPYYGAKNASTFGDLMKDHLVIAADLVKAAAAGDTTKATSLEKQWYDNAKAISVLLNKLNRKNWPTNAVYSMMQDHLKFTKAEAVARITKDYTADITAYDRIHNQALMMADTFSNGIIKQFPGKVAGFKAEPIVKISSKSGMGKFLINDEGMTLYVSAKDTANKSVCYGQCAVNWPPLTNESLTKGVGVTGALKFIERTDLVKQITYKGMPLYLWISDKKPGDTTGQGINGFSIAKP